MSSASDSSPLLALRNQEAMKSLDTRGTGGEIVDIGGADNDHPDGSPDGEKGAPGQDTSASSSTHAPVGPEGMHKLGEADDNNDKDDDFDIEFVDDDGDDMDESTDDVVVVDKDDDQLDELSQDMPGTSDDAETMAHIDSDDPIDDIGHDPQDADPLGEDDDTKDNVTKANNDKKLDEAARRRRLIEDQSNNDKKPAFLQNNAKKNGDKSNNAKKNDSKNNAKKSDNDNKSKNNDKKNDSKNNGKKVEIDVKESRQPIKMRMNISRDVNALFAADSTLSEDFKKAAKTIFESAIKTKVRAMGKALNETYQKRLMKESKALQQNIVTKIDQFMDYVVEEWLKENKVAVESGLKSEIMEDLFTGFKRLMAENYIQIPDNKVNVVTALTQKVETLEKRLNESEQKNITMKRRMVAERKATMIANAKQGLALTEQVEFEKLAKDVKFSGTDDFAGKLQTLKESYFTKKVAKPVDAQAAEAQLLSEEVKPQKKTSGDAVVDQVLNVARRMSGTRK